MTITRVEIRIRRLDGNADLPLPEYASQGASGMDVRAAVHDPVVIGTGQIRAIPTGLAVSVPRGYEIQVRPRSGLALKHGIGLVNAPGTIDADYRGEIRIILINWGSEPFTVRRGDRIAQLVVNPVVRAELVEVGCLDATPRGAGGFGHTGLD